MQIPWFELLVVGAGMCQLSAICRCLKVVCIYVLPEPLPRVQFDATPPMSVRSTSYRTPSAALHRSARFPHHSRWGSTAAQQQRQQQRTAKLGSQKASMPSDK